LLSGPTAGVALAPDTKESRPVQDPSQWHALVATWLGAFMDGLDTTIFAISLAVFMPGRPVGAAILGLMADYAGRARALTAEANTFQIASPMRRTPDIAG
jgi:hypothetical protein